MTAAVRAAAVGAALVFLGLPPATAGAQQRGHGHHRFHHRPAGSRLIAVGPFVPFGFYSAPPAVHSPPVGYYAPPPRSYSPRPPSYDCPPPAHAAPQPVIQSRPAARMTGGVLVMVVGLVCLLAGVASAGVRRLYVLDCGRNIGKDQARWSPGVKEGKPIEFSDNCYLIRHDRGLLLWDTGVPDAVAAMPDGMVVANGAITYRRARTLAGQLTELGVKPADVTYLAVSHTHGDHVGNVALFASSTVLIQGAEYDWAMARPNKPALGPSATITRLAGDHDVFGDGSVTILSTPRPTPGHQSLLVRLPKTGYVVLSGDAVHFRDNWDNKRVPAMNVSREQTLASLQRIQDVLDERRAQLWINHDKAQSDGLRYAPAYYE